MNDDRWDELGPLLSGYVDGELTQQQQQFVELEMRRSEEVRRKVEELRELKARFAELDLDEMPTKEWRERMDDPNVETTRNVGWIIFIGGIVLAATAGVVAFFGASDVPVLAKLIVAGVYGGLVLLLISVARQRLIEQKTDKYKDVEI